MQTPFVLPNRRMEGIFPTSFQYVCRPPLPLRTPTFDECKYTIFFDTDERKKILFPTKCRKSKICNLIFPIYRPLSPTDNAECHGIS